MDKIEFLKTSDDIRKQVFFFHFMFLKTYFHLRTPCSCQRVTRKFLKDPLGIENMKERGCGKKLWQHNQASLLETGNRPWRKLDTCFFYTDAIKFICRRNIPFSVLLAPYSLSMFCYTPPTASPLSSIIYLCSISVCYAPLLLFTWRYGPFYLISVLLWHFYFQSYIPW